MWLLYFLHGLICSILCSLFSSEQFILCFIIVNIVYIILGDSVFIDTQLQPNAVQLHNQIKIHNQNQSFKERARKEQNKSQSTLNNWFYVRLCLVVGFNCRWTKHELFMAIWIAIQSIDSCQGVALFLLLSFSSSSTFDTLNFFSILCIFCTHYMQFVLSVIVFYFYFYFLCVFQRLFR